jgi:hypothetical protein
VRPEVRFRLGAAPLVLRQFSQPTHLTNSAAPPLTIEKANFPAKNEKNRKPKREKPNVENRKVKT